VNAIHEPLSGLKNVLQKPHKAFYDFGSGFTKLHPKLNADTLLYFAIHRRQNKTRSRKHTRVKAMLFHSAEALCPLVDRHQDAFHLSFDGLLQFTVNGGCCGLHLFLFGYNFAQIPGC
jgi:hypothetical protein